MIEIVQSSPQFCDFTNLGLEEMRNVKNGLLQLKNEYTNLYLYTLKNVEIC